VDNGRTSILRGYWADTELITDNRIRTPLGSRVTVFKVALDIHYEINKETIVVHEVYLARGDPNAWNMDAVRTGEGFHADNFEPRSALAAVVQRDLQADEPQLGKLLIGKWREEHPDQHIPYLKPPFKLIMRCLPPGETEMIAPKARCEVCGKPTTLNPITSGQLLCPECLKDLRRS